MTPLVPLVTVTVSSSFTAFVLSVAEGASLSCPKSVIVKVAVSVASCSSDKVYVKVSVKVSLASKPDILSLAAYV